MGGGDGAAVAGAAAASHLSRAIKEVTKVSMTLVSMTEADGAFAADSSPAAGPWWESSDVAVGHRWHVLHTRPRQEKALGAALAGMGLHFYLPLIARTTRYGRRKITSRLPLFPGYLFLHGTREQAFWADRTRRVAQIIDVPDQDELWRELASIRRALEVDVALDPYPYLKTGVRVCVRSGPLQGLEGVVEDRTRMDRLILRVQTLGQAVAMEIDGALLEPME